MGGRAPVTILTDQDASIVEACAAALPETKHAFYLWHITQKFRTWFKSTPGVCYGDFIREFYAMLKLETTENFERDWLVVAATYGLEENSRIKGLYELRDKWATPYLGGFFFSGMTTTQRGESYNLTVTRTESILPTCCTNSIKPIDAFKNDDLH